MTGLLKPTHDIVFQELFGKQKNKDITAHLISLILNKEIKNIDLDVNKRMTGKKKKSKTGRLDIRAKFNDGEDCNIELQVERYNFMPQRMLNYWANMYSNKITSGQEYDILKPSISILIATFKLPQTKDINNYHSVWNLRESTHPELVLTNNIEMHILEIPKIKKVSLLNNELVQWLRFIKNPEDAEVEKVMEENKYYKQAREELAYLSGDPSFQRDVEDRAGFLMDQECYKRQIRNEALAKGEKIGKKRGRAEGRAEGEKHNKIEIAKKLKSKKNAN